ncbi:MAG: hypothetical protein O7I42_26935 [Alphaproteobacteria bacterium]|nr:hypothetical protein [Alphaproteobacteria bacterium]
MDWRAHIKWVEAVGLFALALWVRLYLINDTPRLEHPPSWDEIYHILAARSWMANGSLAIADGEYSRVPLFTISLGFLFRFFGDDLTVARSYSAVGGSALVAALFLWVRWNADRWAAWLAALLLCFSPMALFQSQHIRFYSLHAVVFWLGSVAVYALVMCRLRRWHAVLVTILAAWLFSLAMYLQITTLIGLAGISLWALFAWLARSGHELLTKSRANWLLLLWSVLLLAAAAIALNRFYPGLAGLFYFKPPMWSQQTGLHSYYMMFIRRYPSFWSLLPLAAIFAIARKSQPGIFCASIFGTAIVLHSLVPPRAERYIYYLLPFFFALWAIVLIEAAPYLRRLAAEVVRRTLNMKPRRCLDKTVASLIIWFVVLFMIASNPAFPIAYRMLAGGPVEFGGIPLYWWKKAPAWEAAAATLNPFIEHAAIVLTTRGIMTLYHLGRYDIEISKGVLQETDTGEEFGIDRRTGQRVISTAESLRQVMACYPSGLIVTTDCAANAPGSGPSREFCSLYGLSPGATDVVLSGTTVLPLRERSGLRAFYWEHPEGTPLGKCSFVAPDS